MKQKVRILIGLIWVPIGGLNAWYHTVHKATDLKSLLSRYQYAAVCFASSAQKQTFQELQDKIKEAGEEKVYRKDLKHDVGFILVNIASKKAYEIPQQYALKNFPSCIVFQNGELSIPLQPLINPQSSYDIVQMLENRFGAEINKLLKDRPQGRTIDLTQGKKSYYTNSNNPNEWYPLPNYPYSRWGARPYNISWGLEYDN